MKFESFLFWFCFAYGGVFLYDEYRRTIPDPLLDKKEPLPSPIDETMKLIQEKRTKPEPIFFGSAEFGRSGPLTQVIIHALGINGAPVLVYEVPFLDKEESATSGTTLYGGRLKFQLSPKTLILPKILRLGVLYLIIRESNQHGGAIYPINSDKFVLDLKNYPLRPGSKIYLQYIVSAGSIMTFNPTYHWPGGLELLTETLEAFDRQNQQVRETLLVALGVKLKEIQVSQNQSGGFFTRRMR